MMRVMKFVLVLLMTVAMVSATRVAGNPRQKATLKFGGYTNVTKRVYTNSGCTWSSSNTLVVNEIWTLGQCYSLDYYYGADAASSVRYFTLDSQGHGQVCVKTDDGVFPCGVCHEDTRSLLTGCGSGTPTRQYNCNAGCGTCANFEQFTIKQRVECESVVQIQTFTNSGCTGPGTSTFVTAGQCYGSTEYTLG